jgi:hypothetical protein
MRAEIRVVVYRARSRRSRVHCDGSKNERAAIVVRSSRPACLFFHHFSHTKLPLIYRRQVRHSSDCQSLYVCDR